MNDAVTTGPPDDPQLRSGVSLPDHSFVPWTALEIVILFFLVLVLWNSAANEVLRGTGFFSRYYPPDTPEVESRQQLWPRTLAFPFQVATIPLFFALLHGVRPRQLGLTSAHFGRNLWLGILWAAFLIPVVFSLFQLLVWLNTNYLGNPGEPHPLAQLAGMGLSRLEWGLLLFIAVVAAPVIEELLFRGVIQPWAAKTRWGGDITVGLAAFLAVALRWKGIDLAVREAWRVGWPAAGDLLRAFTPLLFVLVLLPVIYLSLRRSVNNVGPAVAGTALLFAMVHVSVWPSPVALFVLALGLGTLKERTHSIVGPVVLHSLFNAVSCALLLRELR